MQYSRFYAHVLVSSDVRRNDVKVLKFYSNIYVDTRHCVLVAQTSTSTARGNLDEGNAVSLGQSKEEAMKSM